MGSGMLWASNPELWSDHQPCLDVRLEPPMAFLGFLGATLVLALAIRSRFEPEATRNDFGKRFAVLLLLWFAILVGLNWLLVLSHLLTVTSLRFGAIACAVSGGLIMLRHRRQDPEHGSISAFDQISSGFEKACGQLKKQPPLMHAVLSVVALSLLYVLVRGLILGGSVNEFDAISYHLPKAVEVSRAQTIPHLVCGDFRLAYFPWNYELLLADGLLLSQGDGFIFLVPLMAYLGFAGSTYALFRKAWPETSSVDISLGVLLVLSTPILILHITANKNDLLVVFLQMEFLLWSTLWYLNRDQRSLLLSIISLAMLFGTKVSALFLGPFLLVMLWRRRACFTLEALGGPKKALTQVGIVIFIVLALGAAWPLLNLAWTGKIFGNIATAGGIDSFEANVGPRYNGFSNLWRFPVLVFLKPFSSNDLSVWVPWEHRYWFWPTYRLIYGHFGWLCTVLLALLPAGLFYHLRKQREAASFRMLITIGMVAFVAFTLPVNYRVDGLFHGSARYILCIPVLVVLWTGLPLLSWVKENGRHLIHGVLAVGALAYFSGQSWVYFEKDETRPFEMVLEALSPPPQPNLRTVAEALDFMAGPKDSVALDGGYGALFYPIYGARLERPVCFLRPNPGTVAIPDHVKWVLIDRSFNVGWSHPGVTSVADFWLPIKPRPTEEDMAVFRQLSKDPGWRMVCLIPTRNEAIFLRQSMVGPP